MQKNDQDKKNKTNNLDLNSQSKIEKKAQQKSQIDSEKNNDKDVIEDLKLKLQQCEDRVLRCLADNENLRKRHEREIEDNLKYSNKAFGLSLLTIADNFQRALDSIPDDKSIRNELFENLITGVKAIEKEFFDVFEKNGIIKFSSKNQKFNPEIHQAVNQIFSEVEEGHVVEELQFGFKIGDRLLRPSMVIVSKGVEKKNIKSEKEENKETNFTDNKKQ